jgi:hypothetical protein
VADLQIDFENEVGKCEFRPAPVKEVEDWRKRRPEETQGKSDDQLANDLGRIVLVGKARKIRPTSKAMQEAVKLLIERERIPLPFHEVALKIAQAIGLFAPDHDRLWNWENMSTRLRMISEGRAYVRDEKNRYGRKKAVQWPHPAAQLVGEIGVFLVPNAEGKPVLSLKPDSPNDALVLYAAHMRANGTTFQLCEHCNIPFLSGGEGRGGGKRRGDARFCSDECRYSYHNEMRRKTARKTKL